MDQLCKMHVLMHRKLAFQSVFRIAAKTDPKDHDVAIFDLRIGDRADREAFRRNGRAGRSPSGDMIHRIGKLSDGTVQEASGVLFGVRCMDPASAHLAPPLFCAHAPHFPAPMRSSPKKKGPARPRLCEPSNRAGPFRQDTTLDPRPCIGVALVTGPSR